MSIKEIEQMLFTNIEINEDYLDRLRADNRKGVQDLLKRWDRTQERKRINHEKFIKMSIYEQKYHQEGYQYIAGIDEVGRGPLAGPVVAAAVILPQDFYLPGIDDSKKLTQQNKELYYQEIYKHAIAIGIGKIENDEIDQLNIYEATKKAMLAALIQLNPKPDFLLIDAVKLETPYPSEPIIKGDSLSISIAAASIIAKVTRDQILSDYDKEYPNYGFANNAGYGTKQHIEAIEKYGITPIHRKSFSPVKEYIDS